MKYTYSIRVGYSDLGLDGNMTYGAAVDAMQDCSNFQSMDLGNGLEKLIENKRAWLLNYWQIQFLKPMRIGDKIDISTWPYDFDKLFGYRNFCIQDENGEYTVKANSMWFLVNLETFRPMKLQEEDVAAYGMDSKLDMEYEDKRVKLPEEMLEIDRIKIHNYHIDTNGHVNNAWYIKIAMEYIEKDKPVKQIRVEYKKSAVLNDEVIIKKSGNVIGMYDKDGKIYVAIEVKQ